YRCCKCVIGLASFNSAELRVKVACWAMVVATQGTSGEEQRDAKFHPGGAELHLFHSAGASSRSPAASSCASPIFWRRAKSTKKSGTKSVATKVAISMPPTTPVPMERRAADPAPVATDRDITPKTNASEVITIGR